MTTRPKSVRDNQGKSLTEIAYQGNKSHKQDDVPVPQIEKRAKARLLRIDGVFYCGKLCCEDVELFEMTDGTLKCGNCYEVYTKD